MNIKQMKGFLELSKTLNFSKTAKQMYMSQPAFSRMIESMEKEIGVKLIQRDKALQRGEEKAHRRNSGGRHPGGEHRPNNPAVCRGKPGCGNRFQKHQ